MPAMTPEQAQKLEAQLKETIAGLGDAPDVAKKRELGKKIRRAQRLQRRMAVEAAKRAKAAPKPKPEAAAAPAAPAAEEKPAEEAPAEAPAEDAPAAGA